MITILKDDFHGANTANLVAHTPQVGGPYTNGAGWAIQGNKAVGVGNTPYADVALKAGVGEIGIGIGNITMGPGDEFFMGFAPDPSGTNDCNIYIGSDGKAALRVFTGGVERDFDLGPVANGDYLNLKLGPSVAVASINGAMRAVAPTDRATQTPNSGLAYFGGDGNGANLAMSLTSVLVIGAAFKS